MEQKQIEERVRRVAARTEKLITSLDTINNRIETAKLNDNADLVEYYEQEFNKTSVEFMTGVESLLDDWYSLQGRTRSRAAEEFLSEDDLEDIHSAVVRIVMGLSPEVRDRVEMVSESPVPSLEKRPAGTSKARSRSNLDVTG